MPSASTPEATSTRCFGPPDSGRSISTVTGAASRSRPKACGAWRWGRCPSVSRQQDVRRARDLEWPAAELRLDRADAARQEGGSVFRRDGIQTDRHRPPPRSHIDVVLRAAPCGRLLEPHNAGFTEAGLPRDGGEGLLILDRPAGDELIAGPRRGRQ